MVQEGPIAHRYGGEPDVAGRAAQAGAHFSVIEENVATGPTAAGVHDEWMHSPGHRANLLSAEVDRVGIAVIEARGVLYAVADYSRAMENLSPTQVEERFASLIRPAGVAVLRDAAAAREACATDSGVPRGATPRFVMRWQGSELNDFAQQVKHRINESGLREAAVGSCTAQNVAGSFSAYRLAVLLY
jgi:hypothetical protein